ncbi:MaoC family dehydratase [Halovenus salina]|uniref:MaoC family dehydratase n=1 Tax=Halovenus salina TaxID=1510225 RepID=A0ABD5W1A6_9EURY|nr:MaoC family dehydratase [Halovenus salina]
MFESVVAANRAALAAFGLDADGTDEVETTDRIEADKDLPEWDTETTASAPEDVSVGDRFEFSKTISDGDVRAFAAASGDTNPLHLDDEFAEKTRFQGRIAHGTLVGGLISAALARVPGLVIYLSQDLEFHNPVRISETLTASCEIVEDLGNNQYRLSTPVHNEAGEAVIEGEAVILIDEQPE